MNDFDFQLQLDRLADGELPAEDYRALLATLDAQPDGWRRCALALLEAQALRRDLEALRSDCLQAPAAVVKAMPLVAEPREPRPWLMLLAMAASFLIALPVGPYLLRLWQSPQKHEIVEQPQPKSKAGSRTSPPITNTSASPELGKLVLQTANGQLEVPYYDVAHGAKYLLDDKAMLSEAAIRSLERSGHHVERTPSVMPVDLESGERVYLPVDNYRITPVQQRTVQ
jgi:hypothetical protein